MRHFLLRILVGGLLFGVLAGGGLLYKALAGAAVGARCEDASDCKGLEARCIEDEDGAYCTTGCARDADCEGGWSCVSTVVVDETGRETGAVDRLCARPLNRR